MTAASSVDAFHTEGPVPEEFYVIVHSSGPMEDEGVSAYWTEVPALAACMGEGSEPDEAVDDTRSVITRWLTYTRGQAPPLHLITDYSL